MCTDETGRPLSEKGNQAAQTSPLEAVGESPMPPNGHLRASETQQGDAQAAVWHQESRVGAVLEGIHTEEGELSAPGWGHRERPPIETTCLF